MAYAKRAGAAAVAVTLVIGVGACASNDPGDAPRASSSEVPATSQTPVVSPAMTLDQYILANDITSSAVGKGEPGAPAIALPIPSGWEAAESRAPERAYDALVYTAHRTSLTPPTIVAFVSELSGDVDPALVLEYAANETRALPGFHAATERTISTLANYQATQVSGSYTKNGVKRLIEQTTVVIPTQDGLFVLKITTEGPEDLTVPLREANAAIDEHTTITP